MWKRVREMSADGTIRKYSRSMARTEALSEVHSFLDAFRALPIDAMAPAERAAAVGALAEERLKGSSNAIVRALCQ